MGLTTNKKFLRNPLWRVINLLGPGRYLRDRATDKNLGGITNENQVVLTIRR